jgi:hypothetical protein
MKIMRELEGSWLVKEQLDQVFPCFDSPNPPDSNNKPLDNAYSLVDQMNKTIFHLSKYE